MYWKLSWGYRSMLKLQFYRMVVYSTCAKSCNKIDVAVKQNINLIAYLFYFIAHKTPSLVGLPAFTPQPQSIIAHRLVVCDSFRLPTDGWPG